MTTPTTRLFHIGDVLSVTTGKLVSPRHMAGIYEVLNYLTGDDVYTHQIPRSLDAMQIAVLAQHPQLADVDASGVDPETWRAWLAEQVERFGEEIALAPAHDLWERRDPVEEAERKFGKDRVMTIRITGDRA